jgi:hypothetical protein
MYAPSGLHQHFNKVHKFGDPHHSQAEAEAAVKRIAENTTMEATKSELSEEQREQLQQLGYL